MFQEDLSIFLKDFAENAVFTLSDNTTLSIKGIFDEAYYNPQLGEIDLDASQPRLTCISAEIAAVKKNDTVLIPANTAMGRNTEKIYTVFRIQPDGTGISMVVLSDDYS